MLLADERFTKQFDIYKDDELNIVDTEDLVCERIKVGKLMKLEGKGIVVSNLERLGKPLFKSRLKSLEKVYLYKPVKSITILYGGIQFVKISLKHMVIFFEDNYYIELQIKGYNDCYFNDNKVQENVVCFGLPYIEGGNLFISAYNDYGIRYNMGVSRSLAQPNGILKRRQLLLERR